MVLIPDNPVTQKDLEEWYVLQDKIAKLKASEMLLRTKIFKFFFPTPVEGTNTAELPDGFALKGQYKIQRDIDQGAFEALKDRLREAGINADKLVRWKPELTMKEYRALTEEERQLADQFLIVKPGAPSLEIVQPKRKS